MARGKLSKFIGFMIAVAPVAFATYRFLKENGYLDKAKETAQPYVDKAVDTATEYYEVVKDKATDAYTKVADVAEKETDSVQEVVEEPISKPSDSI